MIPVIPQEFIKTLFISRLMMKYLNPTFVIFFSLLIGVTVLTACGDESSSSTSADQSITEITESDENFSGLSRIMKDTDVTAYLEGDGPFTVFAPRNEAVNNLPPSVKLPDGIKPDSMKEMLGEVLKYHVLTTGISSSDLQAEQEVEAAAGGKLFITAEDGEIRINDTATVTNADIGASNGVIHTIDQLLLPDKYQDVVGIISKRYMLQTLEEAVGQAELTETLKTGDGEGFTVFAPSDSAFEDIDLSALTQQQLQGVLRYHVLPNKVLSGDLSASQSVETVNGEMLDIAVSGEGTVLVTDKSGNEYRVTTADLEGANGVVHIIDGVLIPE